MSIGKRIKELRESRGMTIKQTACELDISASTYRDWELGTKISGEPYGRMAEVFGVSLSFLLTGKKYGQSDIMEDLYRVKLLLDKMEKNINLTQ